MPINFINNVGGEEILSFEGNPFNLSRGDRSVRILKISLDKFESVDQFHPGDLVFKRGDSAGPVPYFPRLARCKNEGKVISLIVLVFSL